MAGQNVGGWYKDADGVWHEIETGGSSGCGGCGGWYQDIEGVWHEEEEVAAEVAGVSEVARWRASQGSSDPTHGYALPSALGMPISGLLTTALDDPAALACAVVVPEVMVPECATCLGALLNGGMGCTPHFVPGKVPFRF